MSEVSPFRLDGKRVLVTGANTGIGQGIAVSLGQAGAHVMGVARSDQSETEGLVKGVGGGFSGYQIELDQAGAAEKLIGDGWAEGAIDGVVNNAGIIRREDSENLSTKDWADVIDLNLTVPFEICQHFARKVFEHKRAGKIVNVASLLSFQGGIRVASYTSSKHGIAGLTKVLANEWAAKGINVNAIAPGYIETNNTQALREDSKRSAEILGRIPAGRWGVASDIGDTATFLLAPASDYIHGTIISVDGGWLAR